MTYCEAVALLDKRRNGSEMPEYLVLQALSLTGDFEPPEERQPGYPMSYHAPIPKTAHFEQ